MKITFQDFRKTIQIILEIDKDPATISMAQLRKQISLEYEVKYADISFIYNGYKIPDNSNLKQIKYTEETYIVITIRNIEKYPKIQEIKKEIQTENDQNEKKETKKETKQFIEQLREDLEEDEKRNTDGMSASLLTQMLASGPLKDLLKNNPELESFMGNEKEMKKILKISTNKDLQNYTMRQNEIALTQIDHIPGANDEVNRVVGGLYNDLDNVFNKKIKYDPNKTNDDFKQKEELENPVDIFQDLSKQNTSNGMNDFMGMMGNPYGNSFGNSFGNPYGNPYGNSFGNRMGNIFGNPSMNSRPQNNPFGIMGSTQMKTPPRKQQPETKKVNQIEKKEEKPQEKIEVKKEQEKVEVKVEQSHKELSQETYDELIETLDCMGFDIDDEIKKIVKNSSGDLMEIIEAIEKYKDTK